MKNNKGFSLVELIVVIAIMAILAAVAVAGFSMYIPKAQQATDKQMIADIEDQLIYAGYAGAFEEGEGGYVILSPEGVIAIEGAGLEQVLINAYGENYDDKLKLAYDEWGNNGLFVGLVNGKAADVYNSTYYDVSDKLMGQVQEITNAALAILDADSEQSTEKMLALFADSNGNQDFLNDVAKMYGYVDANGNGDVSKVSAEELPNFLVLAVATDITTAANNPQGHSISQASSLVQSFALYNAYAATDDGKAAGFDEAYETFVTTISAPDASVSTVANAYKTLQSTANSDAKFDAYITNGNSATDYKAFQSMMGGLAGATGSNNTELTKNNMSDPEFFTTGVGSNLFNTYIDSVESFVGIPEGSQFVEDIMEDGQVKEGVVAIYFSFVNSQMVINNTIPVN